MSKDELVLRIESLERQVQQLLFAMQSYVGEELDSGMRADEPDERHRGEPVRGDFRPSAPTGRPPILPEPEVEAVQPPSQRTWQPQEPAERVTAEFEQPEAPTPKELMPTWQPEAPQPPYEAPEQAPEPQPPREFVPTWQPDAPQPPREFVPTWQPDTPKPPAMQEYEQPPPPEPIPEPPPFVPERAGRQPEVPSEAPEAPVIQPPETPSAWQPDARTEAPKEFVEEPPPQQAPPAPTWEPPGKPRPEDVRGWETLPDIVDVEDIFGEKKMEEDEEKDTKRDKGYEETLLDQARDTAERYQDMLDELGKVLQQMSDSMMGLRAQMQNTSAQIETSDQMMA